MENRNRVIGGVVVLVLLVLGLSWWSMNGAAPAAQVTTVPTAGSTDALVVSDMRPNDVVVVDSVTLSEPGFVAIHADQGGVVGAIVGVSDYLSAGTHTGVPVKISKAAANGDTLYAMIHVDDGDRIFSAALDLPREQNGEPVMMRFHVDVNAPAGSDYKL